MSWPQFFGYLGGAVFAGAVWFGIYTYVTRARLSKGWKDSGEGE